MACPLSPNRLWQRLKAGQLTTPQEIHQEALVVKAEKDADSAFERFTQTYQDGNAAQVPARLRYPSWFTSEALLKQYDRADYQHCHQGLLLWSALFIDHWRKLGVPLYTHAAFRTKAQQNALSSSVTKVRWPRAAHCQGKAVDIVHSVFHWEMTKLEWDIMGKIGKDVHRRLMASLPASRRFNLIWGGDWKFYDPAHWEVEGWQSNVLELPEGSPIRSTPRYLQTHEGIPSSRQRSA